MPRPLRYAGRGVSASFTWRRVALLLRVDALLHARLLLVQSAAVAAVLLLLSLVLRGLAEDAMSNYRGAWLVLLFAWGPIVASFAFRELHDKTRNANWLLVPASALEKIVARGIWVTFGAFVFLLLYMTLVSALIEALHALAFGSARPLFHPLQGSVWTPFGHFLVVVSLYFAGAAWFRRAQFFKTTLVLAVIPIVLIVLLREDLTATAMAWFLELGAWGDPGVRRFTLVALQLLYFVALPAFCWFLVWLRIRESQVSHGI
jgi:ABC-type antimicrobial peptide transport system permease subunit